MIGFEELARKMPQQIRISSQDLLPFLAQAAPEDLQAAKAAIVARIVPPQGLIELVRVLERTTNIRIQSLLDAADLGHWPQIRVAFEIRHLVEHRDGKIDARFLDAVTPGLWCRTSWGARGRLETLEKVRVEQNDVERTFDAMIAAVKIIGGALHGWSKGWAGTPS